MTGLRLALGAWPTVLDAPAHAYLNQRIDLTELWDDTSTLAARLARADSASARLVLLQAEVRSRCSAFEVDPLMAALVEHLARRGARVFVIADRLGLSPRQVQRRCLTALGYPASMLAKLVRFQTFLHRLNAPSPQRRRLADLAVAAGYSDQSHLTRDCRTLTGLRPSSLVPPAGR